MTSEPRPALMSEEAYFKSVRFAAEPLVFVEHEGKMIVGTAYGYDRVILDVVKPEDLGEWLVQRWRSRKADVEAHIERRRLERENSLENFHQRREPDISGLDLEDLELDI